MCPAGPAWTAPPRVRPSDHACGRVRPVLGQHPRASVLVLHACANLGVLTHDLARVGMMRARCPTRSPRRHQAAVTGRKGREARPRRRPRQRPRGCPSGEPAGPCQQCQRFPAAQRHPGARRNDTPRYAVTQHGEDADGTPTVRPCKTAVRRAPRPLAAPCGGPALPLEAPPLGLRAPPAGREGRVRCHPLRFPVLCHQSAANRRRKSAQARPPK